MKVGSTRYWVVELSDDEIKDLNSILANVGDQAFVRELTKEEQVTASKIHEEIQNAMHRNTK